MSPTKTIAAMRCKIVRRQPLGTRSKPAESTRPSLDKDLVESVKKKFGHAKSTKEAVEDAMRVFLHVSPQMHIVALFGRVDFDPNWDYKGARRAKQKDR